ncbi:MAG: GTP cyclohydrolase I FolE [Actinobacteria bacterium]|nr:GTP cyclohydrolase I FolE [Actinomycetota bacterium]MCA1806310.1 GTP cyclohydrolase I FolE [Actinomycetota bacterium]
MGHYEKDAENGIKYLLTFIGEDPARLGLRDTPKRVLKAWAEMTSGYHMVPEDILSKNFVLDDADDADSPAISEYNSMIISKDIPFVSNCEHHMMPFIGHAHVGYIPASGGRVVGLSKLARLVEAYALRLQIQERMTQQIADAIQLHLQPLGVMVVVEAQHSCQAHRGVRKAGKMVTSALHGVFRDSDNQARNEFLELIRRG